MYHKFTTIVTYMNTISSYIAINYLNHEFNHVHVQTSATVPPPEWSVGTVTLVVGIPLNTDTLVKTRIAGTTRLTTYGIEGCHYSNYTLT